MSMAIHANCQLINEKKWYNCQTVLVPHGHTGQLSNRLTAMQYNCQPLTTIFLQCHGHTGQLSKSPQPHSTIVKLHLKY